MSASAMQGGRNEQRCIKYRTHMYVQVLKSQVPVQLVPVPVAQVQVHAPLEVALTTLAHFSPVSENFHQ